MNLFTSESVTSGHPDKLCDQISDAILDAYLKEDPKARVACEVCAGNNFVLIMGEITSTAQVDIEQVARKTIIDIGYDREELGFDGHNCEIKLNMNKQSPDIAMGVDGEEIGAGDQGIMFGYATSETEEYIGAANYYSHLLAKRLEYVRRNILDYLRPDGKTQVTVEYDEDKIKRIDTIVISTQHNPDIDMVILKRDVIKHVIEATIPLNLMDSNTKILINPTGRFVIGGPVGDSGLTGRKIIVDTYGGYARHGGGAFSGKDYTKVDRSASYYARYVAKNIVAAGLAEKIEIEVAYAIGIAKPVSIHVNTFGTGKLSEEELLIIINNNFDFRPSNIIKELTLDQPIYQPTASYGHFGRSDINLPWEQLNKIEFLKSHLK